jgi:hypothetical protein
MSCSCNCADEIIEGRKVFQYAVKVVIGLVPENMERKPLPAGAYFTKVNIHNYDYCDCVRFRWKVAIGNPGLRVGPVSEYQSAEICADEAVEIDTWDIAARIKGLLPTQGNKFPKHAEGWVVIESPVELDVVAVYGTAASSDSPVNAFHTERVEPRCVAVCDDFFLDISTGVSAWEYMGPGDTSFQPATLSGPQGPWSQPLPGSIWIVPGSNKKIGDHVFRLRFKFCFGFSNPQLTLKVMADDRANVFLNGSQVPPNTNTGTMFSTPKTYSTTSFFKSGDNELLIKVKNVEAPLNLVGLDVAGTIFAEMGLCRGYAMPLLPCPTVCYGLRDRTFWWNTFIGMFVDLNQRNTWGCDGDQVGETSGWRKAEQLQVMLQGSITPGTSIEYRVFDRLRVGSGSNWTAFTSSGFAGNTGPHRGITAIEVRLVNAPVNCHVRYRVCSRFSLGHYDPNPSWSGYSYDGAPAGTTGGGPLFRTIVAVEIQIV